jgi:hypothetical protein
MKNRKTLKKAKNEDSIVYWKIMSVYMSLNGLEIMEQAKTYMMDWKLN